jgi:hypothetical protein
VGALGWGNDGKVLGGFRISRESFSFPFLFSVINSHGFFFLCEYDIGIDGCEVFTLSLSLSLSQSSNFQGGLLM